MATAALTFGPTAFLTSKDSHGNLNIRETGNWSSFVSFLSGVVQGVSPNSKDMEDVAYDSVAIADLGEIMTPTVATGMQFMSLLMYAVFVAVVIALAYSRIPKEHGGWRIVAAIAAVLEPTLTGLVVLFL